MNWEIIIKLGILCAAIFAVQLAVCLKASKVMTRLWPVIILTGLEIVCGIIVLAVGMKTDTGTVISSFAGAQMIIVGVLLIPVDLAWVIYGVIWLIKKIINKSEV